jgi:eukaryotic-like serine/threonine-protein kinase
VITAREQVPELVKYELLEKIGFGGMATVYRARDRRLGREVAVKLIHAHLRESAEVAVRFVSEARAVARLRHPNVVEVFDVSDETEPERYLVVELVRGTTLRALISRHKKLPAELVAAIGLEVAAALSHAHEQGIIHRDVKPENVLIELVAETSSSSPGSERPDRPRVKLTDFGIAKLLDAQGVTSTGQVLGSPAHMAPEQIEGTDVGPRADVFALGVMLYEAMVGRLPFDGKNPAQVLRRVLEGSYPPAVREEPKVGALLGDVLARALVREASGRYESIEAFARALRAELERLGITDHRREIDAFLNDQNEYVEQFTERIVKELANSGDRARADSQFQLAAAQWNRALAYRPGDSALLARATRLARRERLLTFARRSAGTLAVVAALGASFFAWRKFAATPGVEARRPAAETKSVGEVAPLPSEAPGGTATAALGSAEAPAVRHRVVLKETPRPRPESATRSVDIDVIGAKGGVVKIDGQPDQNWYIQKRHELTVGEHTFEFVPQDPECCQPVPPVTRTIEAGDMPMKVLLTLQFRDAKIKVERSRAGVMRCPTLFPTEMTVPGTLGVRMSRSLVSGQCTMSPTDQTEAPQTKDVTLQPGQTTEITW